MRGIVGAGLVLLVVGGCGDNRAPGGGVVSGSRLRARYVAHGDARQFLGFHDVERDEDCGFVWGGDADDAVCLPTYEGIAAYADADCETPVIAVWEETCATVARYVATFTGAACTAQLDRVWAIDLQRTTDTLFVATPDGCFAATPREGYRYHPAREEVPLAAFVHADVAIEDTDDRLRDRYLAGDDGSRLSIGAYDATLDTNCYLDQAYAEPITCVPASFEGGWHWTDDACSEPVLQAYEWCGDAPPRFGVMWSRGEGPAFGECWSRRVHELGEPVALDDVYYGIGSCSVEEATGTFYSLGAEVADDTLAHGARALGGGEGRLGMYYLQAGAYQRATGTLRDHELGVDCTISAVSGGELRCLPVGGSDASWLYADDSCTTRAEAASFWGDSCTGVWPDTRFSQRWDYTDCVSTARVHEVGAELTPGSLYTTDEQGACVPYVWDTTNARFYEQRSEVPLTTFARLDEILE